MAPRRPCAGSPTCKAFVEKGRCPSCARKRERQRGSRHARGYDAAWVRLRDEFLADPVNRHCVRCAARDRQRRATEVDHDVPFQGLADPRRLDRQNLRPLCGTCHRQKTAEQQRRADVVWNGEMDRQGSCPSLVDGGVRRPSTLTPANRVPFSTPVNTDAVRGTD
ncbi:MAG TPA: HNH endonuclease [Gemmatimonadales bacterium]|nr:HNH endonuclease [Gemmatimonadales bacterium]